MNGVRKFHRKSVIPKPIFAPFPSGAGNHSGPATPSIGGALALATKTNTDTITFLNSATPSASKVATQERCVAPIYVDTSAM